MLAMGDDPSYHSRPAVLHLGNLLHSLAIGIARDKSNEYSLSTRKLSLTSKIVLVGKANSMFICKVKFET